jgi:hypothetical protein
MVYSPELDTASTLKAHACRCADIARTRANVLLLDELGNARMLAAGVAI